MGMGPSVGETGVHVQSMVCTSIVGVHAWGVMGTPGACRWVTMSLFSRVTAGLGSSQSGREGTAGWPGSGCMGSGLAS